MAEVETYEERAMRAMDIVLDDSADKADLYRLLDAMTDDDLYALHRHADLLSLHARREWLHRTKRPAGG